MATTTTSASLALQARLKNRRLPSLQIPDAKEGEVKRTLEGIAEHLRMYEGDSKAPKERFVTIAELENAGLIKADVKQGFGFISQVLEKDVAQKAGSTANPTLKDPVKRDTSRQSRTPGGSGAGSSSKANQASTATTAKLNDSKDVSVAKPAQKEFLYYDGATWTNFPLFARQNIWTKQQQFSFSLKMQALTAGPAAQTGFGYLWSKKGTPTTLWFTDSAGTHTQLATGSGASSLFDLTEVAADPDADAVPFWDDSAGDLVWYSAGSLADFVETALVITESQISDLGSYMLAVVDDPTPDLGGDLDVSGFDIISTVGGGQHITFDSFASIIFKNQGTTIASFNPAGEFFLYDNVQIQDGSLTLTSTGDVALYLKADTDNSGEDDNPFIRFEQDGNLVRGVIGLTGATSVDAQGNTFTNAGNNGISIHSFSNGGTAGNIALGCEGAVALAIASDNAAEFFSTVAFSSASPLIASGKSSLSSTQLYIDGKKAFRSVGTWLYMNDGGDFSSGMFTPGIVRADGGLNAGNGDFTASSTGDVYSDRQYTGGFGAISTGGTTDFNHSSNARSGMGYSLLRGSDTNGPGAGLNVSTSNYNHILNFEYSSKTGSGNLLQYALPYTNGDAQGIRQRTRVSSTWGSWVEYLHTGNGGLHYAAAETFSSSKVTVGTGAASGGSDGDIHYRY